MDKEDGISQKQVILQKSIRAYSANFMQENMMGLQNLPSEEQYAALQAKRSEAIQREIALERQATFQVRLEYLWHHLGKTQLMDEQKEQAVIRRHMLCVASDKSLDFLSYMSICRKHFSRFLHNLKTVYEYKLIEKAN